MLEKCKRNMLHHFLINENTTTPILMWSKKKLLNTWTLAGLAGVARECCSFLARDPREDWEGFSPVASPLSTLPLASRITAPTLGRYLNPASWAGYRNSAHAIYFDFVAIFCYGTKQYNATGKTKVKTALVRIIDCTYQNTFFPEVKHDWNLSLIYWDTESLSTLS